MGITDANGKSSEQDCQTMFHNICSDFSNLSIEKHA
jgi:hypothetical protein